MNVSEELIRQVIQKVLEESAQAGSAKESFEKQKDPESLKLFLCHFVLLWLPVGRYTWIEMVIGASSLMWRVVKAACCLPLLRQTQIRCRLSDRPPYSSRVLQN